MRLKLECTACGKMFKVDVGKVFVDQSLGEDRRMDGDAVNFICFGKEVRCLRCGAVDKYRITQNALIHLTAEILKTLSKGLPPHSEYFEGRHEIVVASFGLKDGTRMLPREAERFYRRKLAEDPENSKLHLRLGNVLKFLGRVQEALTEYKKSVELDPKEPEAWYNIGILLKKIGKTRDAEEAFLKSIESAMQNIDEDRDFYEELMASALEELDRLHH